jgi:glycosyltransferase involved in cell wall biosynthesis
MIKLKVLMLAPEPFFEPRGTPISVYQRLWALSSLGYRIDLLTYHVGTDIEIPNVRIIRTPKIPFIRNVKIGPSWVKLLLDFFMVFYAIILLLKGNYDVIHSHEEASFFAMVLARLFRTTHLYDMHSSLPKQLENFKIGNWLILIKLFDALERWVLKTCDAVITIDKDLANHVYRIDPDVPQLVIENLPIRTGSFASTSDDLFQKCDALQQTGCLPIVYTGTFESYQGLELLLESIPIIKQVHQQAYFILVGGQPHQIEQLRTIVRKHQLEADICFIGMVPLEDAVNYLNIAQILVSPRTEGTSVPLKIYSYLHSGKPIVATRLPAHTQVLDDTIAFLVEPTKEALADGIICLLNNPELGQRLGRKARQIAQEHYSMDGYVTNVAQIYAQLELVTESGKGQLCSLEL